MLRPLLVVLALAAVALAGCSGSPPAKEEPIGPGEDLKPTATTGLIRGVVVDGAIRPLEGARVVASSAGVEKLMTSDVNGFFGADGLAPGTWFLSASKLGFDPAQQSVEVVAGEEEPNVVKVLLMENPALRPYSETFVWSGFLQCSAGIPEVGSVNPCFVLSLVSDDLSSNVWEQNVTAVPMTVQAEMVWKPATAVGTSFWLSAFVEGEDLVEPDDYAEVEGGSPLILRIENALLDEKDVGDGQPLALRVFPGIDQPTVFANQAFDVYITVFYGYAPPEGWTFVADGAIQPDE